MQQTVDTCPLCGMNVHKISTAPGYQSSQTFVIYECDGCLCSFASPLEVNDALYNLIYGRIEHVPGYNRYYRYARQVLKQSNPLAYLSRQEESYWAVAQHIYARTKGGQQLRILEAGCWMGYFPYALNEAGFNTTGIDLSPRAIAWARENYGRYFECSTLQELYDVGKRYDLIIMNQLIEHIPLVNLFISQALQLLSPKGELLLTTPNKSAHPGIDWETELPPVHLWWFGEPAMKTIASRNGCDIEFIDFSEFYCAHTKVKTKVTPLDLRRPVFDERGELLDGQTRPLQSLWRERLEQVGLLEPVRRIKMKLLRAQKWQGRQGPICAVVLRPVIATHE